MMEAADQAGIASCISGLCKTCRNFGGAPSNSITSFGSLDDIKNRAPCRICHIASLAIQNHRDNRVRKTHDRHYEYFSVVPEHGTIAQRNHGDCCNCHIKLRIESTHSPPRPIGVIRHIDYHTSSPEPNCQITSPHVAHQLEQSAAHVQEGSLVNISLVHSWLQKCEAEHDHCNSLPAFVAHSAPRLLFIDVVDMCLVESTSSRYIALSYVWGAAKMFKTLGSNLKMLSEKGALKRLGNKIPLLIRDAILIVQRLKERYLWVDSLCIVQDDDKSKHDLINMMDIIYSKAVCTIIVHGSNDASCPIPGIRPNTRQPYRITTSAGTDLNNGFFVFSPYHYTGHPSVYDTRGWTFQEQILSRRRLIFAADQVCFSCQSQPAGDWCEDTLTDFGDTAISPSVVPVFNMHGSQIAIQPRFDPGCCKDVLADPAENWRAQTAILRLSQSVLSPVDNQDQPTAVIYTYTSAVTYYSSRQLSDESDILNAFSGIMSALERTCGFNRGSSIYGLLERHFHHNLHWTSKTTARRDGWPSWSWIGWSSDINWLEREDPGKLKLQIRDIYFINQGDIKTIISNCHPTSSKPCTTTLDATSATPGPITENRDRPNISEIARDRQASLIDASFKLPLIAFWATTANAGTLRLRFHPTRPTNLRVYNNTNEVCGHMHREFEYSSKPTGEVLDRLRLVYISYIFQRCAFHLYAGGCYGSCNTLVVDPGDSQRGYATRVGLAEICWNSWRLISTSEEFVVLA